MAEMTIIHWSATDAPSTEAAGSVEFLAAGLLSPIADQPELLMND
jgi:hypothetical protein